MRFFNTEGPNRAEDHYCLPPLERWDLAEILMLIGQKKYFLLHAPRQRRLRWKPVGGYSISPYHSQWVEIWGPVNFPVIRTTEQASTTP
jgi:hypothetical protein